MRNCCLLQSNSLNELTHFVSKLPSATNTCLWDVYSHRNSNAFLRKSSRAFIDLLFMSVRQQCLSNKSHEAGEKSRETNRRAACLDCVLHGQLQDVPVAAVQRALSRRPVLGLVLRSHCVDDESRCQVEAFGLFRLPGSTSCTQNIHVNLFEVHIAHDEIWRGNTFIRSVHFT